MLEEQKKNIGNLSKEAKLTAIDKNQWLQKPVTRGKEKKNNPITVTCDSLSFKNLMENRAFGYQALSCAPKSNPDRHTHSIIYRLG